MTDDEIEAHKMMQPARDAMAREELRDKFAMAALTGILSFPSDHQRETTQQAVNELSELAYNYADAMLAARKTP